MEYKGLESFKELAESCPDKLALDCDFDDFRLTYKELYDDIIAFSKAMQKYGIKQYEHLAIFSENHPQVIVAHQATWANGCCCALRGTRLDISELDYIYNHSDSCALITDKIETARYFSEKDYNIKFIVLLGKDNEEYEINSSIPVIHYSKFIEEGKNYNEYVEVTSNQDDMAVLFYTSGTSGQPKGVIYTYEILKNFIDNFIEQWEFVNDNNNRVEFMPTWHIGGFVWTYFSLFNTCSIVFVLYEKYVEFIKNQTPSSINCVPKVINILHNKYIELLNAKPRLYRLFYNFLYDISRKYVISQKYVKKIPNSTKSAFSFLYNLIINILLVGIHNIGKIFYYIPLNKEILGQKNITIVSGSAKLSNELDLFLTVYDITYYCLYGMTETGMLASETLVEQQIFSVGKPFKNCKIKIIHPETFEELQNQTKGLVVVKNNSLMKGYYKNPVATQKAFTKDGYLITGDRGYFDEDGFLFIDGRYKDLIVLANGVNIEPITLENLCIQSKYIEQIILSGQDELFLSALVYPNIENCTIWANEHEVDMNNIKNDVYFNSMMLNEINMKIMQRSNFKFCEKVKKILIVDKAFTDRKEFLTNTNKLKRNAVYEYYAKEIKELYNE